MADAPAWNDAGQPANLAAAAADAEEWLLLMGRLVDAGAWKLSRPENREKLRHCRAQLRKFLDTTSQEVDAAAGVGSA